MIDIYLPVIKNSRKNFQLILQGCKHFTTRLKYSIGNFGFLSQWYAWNLLKSHLKAISVITERFIRVRFISYHMAALWQDENAGILLPHRLTVFSCEAEYNRVFIFIF